MKRLALLTACLLCTSGFSGDAEEIIQKHIQARGGLENWEKIENLQMSGSFTAFSQPKPFTLAMARGNRLYFEHHLGKFENTIGCDGQQYWWITPLLGYDAAAILPEAARPVARQYTEFGTPFFHYKERGIQVEYKGLGEKPGQEGHVFQLTYKDGWEETWVLDKDTFLEVLRISKGFDVGDVVDQQTWFSDFRKVGDVMLPHLLETEFRTRHRVMEITKVSLNQPSDPNLFKMPFPKKMAPLESILGTWKAQVKFRAFENAPWSVSENTVVWEAEANGNLFMGKSSQPGFLGPVPIVRQISWDKEREGYTATEFNGMTNHIKTYKGQLEDGVLSMNNLTGESDWEYYGKPYHEKLVFRDLAPNRFVIEVYFSNDAGESWRKALEIEHIRMPDLK